MWLKVLIGFVLTLILALFGFTTGKLDKDTFDRHEKYEDVQFRDIKDSLARIEKQYE
jgi:hypothetical protein